MHRLFVGLRPPPAIRAQLLAAMGGVPNARWQSDAQLHVTLRFIGEVDTPLAEDIAVALTGLHAMPVATAIAGVGVFERRGRANAVWAGLMPRDPLAALHRKVDQALVRAGLSPETRAYLPHITLARLGASAGPVDRFLSDQAGLVSSSFAFEHVILFESRLGREGSSYDAIARYPLGG